jgi:hypothetical protein
MHVSGHMGVDRFDLYVFETARVKYQQRFTDQVGISCVGSDHDLLARTAASVGQERDAYRAIGLGHVAVDIEPGTQHQLAGVHDRVDGRIQISRAGLSHEICYASPLERHQ